MSKKDKPRIGYHKGWIVRCNSEPEAQGLLRDHYLGAYLRLLLTWDGKDTEIASAMNALWPELSIDDMKLASAVFKALQDEGDDIFDRIDRLQNKDLPK